MKILSFVLVGITFIACQKETNVGQKPRAVNLTDTLSLKMGETIFSGDFSIKFDSITQDNRCPINYNCFVAGTATAKFVIQKESQIQTLQLSESEKINPRVPVDTATVFNRRLRLLNVSPYPSDFGIAQRDYVVKLLVR